MKLPKRQATVYLEPILYKALRVKAAATDQTLSELVNEAVRFRLAEDAADLEAFGARANEPSLSFKVPARDPKRHQKAASRSSGRRQTRPLPTQRPIARA